MKTYNKKAPSKYIMYLDANNLYGWAMCQYLPIAGFKWLSEKQIDKLDLAKYREYNTKGLILEVDLEYLKKLHNLHNDYPCAAGKIKLIKICCLLIVKRLLINIIYQLVLFIS